MSHAVNRKVPPFGFLALAVTLLLATSSARCPREVVPVVPLRSGAKPLDERTSNAFVRQVRSAAQPIHGIALVVRPPSARDREALASRGITLLSRITRYSYFVRATPAAAMADTAVTSLVRRWTSLEARDRVAPELWEAQAAGRSLPLVVRFHDDIAVDAARTLLAAHGGGVERLDSTRWQLTAPDSAIRSIAANDIVRWVDAPPRAAHRDMDEAREQIHVDGVQALDAATGKVSGAAGAEITVGLFDFGVHDAHPDFADANGASRVVIDAAISSAHGTAVAGVIVGNGAQSGKPDSWGLTWGRDNGQADAPAANQAIAPWTYRGIAPMATLLDISRADYTPTAAALTTLREYVTKHSMDLSNHSYSFEVNGAYGPVSQLHDRWIRGDDPGDGAGIPPRLHVHSAGNYGWDDAKNPDQWQRGFFSLGTQLKNALVVGNWYAAYAVTSRYSSFGPAHDGRIKPDLVAPGTYLWTTGYCTSAEVDNPIFRLDPVGPDLYACANPPNGASFPRTGFYFPESGTSIAAAVSTGVVALVLSELSSLGEDLDAHAPRPSTLRAIAIHSATDLVGPESGYRTSKDGLLVRPTPGPDFVTGYGLINAGSAVDIVRRGLVREDVLGATCDTNTYSLWVADDDAGPVKVTLAWDDPVSDADVVFSHPLLINDLDLVLIDPNGGRHYPWQLDQEILDSDLSPLGNEAQNCNTPITVKRRVRPSLTATTDGKDDIDDAALCNSGGLAAICPATKGRDHLNNVEQVVTPAIPGKWTVEVTGFMIEQGPQPFSLVGVARPLVLSFDPNWICRKYSTLCPRLFENICKRYAPLCDRPLRIPLIGDTLFLRFTRTNDRQVFVLSALCGALGAPVPCTGRDAASVDRELTIGRAESVGVRVFDTRGNVVAEDTTRARVKSMRIPGRVGETFVVLRPRVPATSRREIAVPVALRRWTRSPG